MRNSAICLFLAMFLSGCGGTGVKPDHEITVKLVVQVATLKYCEKSADPAAKCARVAAVAETAKGLLAGETTIALLREAVIKQLPEDLAFSDRVLALGLLDLISSELQGRLGDGVLDAEQVVAVNQAISWIVEATKFYG